MTSVALLHKSSNLATKSDVELFDLPMTQMTHTGNFLSEFLPLSANYQNGEPIEFIIRNTAEHFLDPNSFQIQVRGKVVRSNGEPIINAAAGDVTADAVYPIDNFLPSMFESVELFLNDVKITTGELYTYRAFLDMFLCANSTLKKETAWPLGLSHDLPGQIFAREGDKGIPARFKLIEASREFELLSPIFTDLCQQGKLLLPDVSVRITFRQNKDKFRLMTANVENREYKIQFTKIVLKARFVKIAPHVSLSIEKALSRGEKALYAIRGVETKHRSILNGVSDVILEDLAPRALPSRLTILFCRTDAFYGSWKLNPLKFEHLDIEHTALFVGEQKIEESYDFDKKHYTEAYMNLIQQLHKPDLKITREQFERNHFLIHYVLNPDRSDEWLSPLTSQNVRFVAKLKKPLPEKITCIILTDSPKVIEVDKSRNITIVDA